MRQCMVLILVVVLTACGAPPVAVLPTSPPATVQSLRLATTTSTADAGLLEVILPAFEAIYKVRVEVIAVGTGQALELGRNGDVDVVLVHDRASEDAFVAAGDGINRRDVMSNDFVIVGPTRDPAGIAATSTGAEAFAAIAATEALFASRGDESGTHSKEKAIWASASREPTPAQPWYKSLGQGMSETLITANELGAYALTDRGTWLSTKANLPDLTILLGGETVADNPDPLLYNPYGVILVNPAKHADINATLAEQFAAWLTSAETQAAIAAYGTERFGQALFYPNATP